MSSKNDGSFAPAHSPAPTDTPPSRDSRYSDQPMDWRTRLVGMGGTAGVGLAIMLCLSITWHVLKPERPPPSLTVINLQSIEAPPEPMREVPEGPEQVEQKPQTSKVQERPDPVPEIVVPLLTEITRTVPLPVERSAVAEPVPETTAPKTLPAPPADRASSDADSSWQALLLAHLEKHRRYPARARAGGQQGVVHLRFKMNRQGRVLTSSVLRSSGHATLDQAALDMLRRAQPLPAIPTDRPEIAELALPVEFFVRR